MPTDLATRLRATADEFGAAMMPDTAALLRSAADALDAAERRCCYAINVLHEQPAGIIQTDLIARLNEAVEALRGGPCSALAAAREAQP